MSAILNSLNAHNFLIFQPILMTFVSKFIVSRALSDKTYLSLGLQSPLNSNSCLNLLTFRSQAAIVSENPLFSLFPIEKPTLPNLTLS